MIYPIAQPGDEYSVCEACGAEAFEFPRCNACHSVDRAYLMRLREGRLGLTEMHGDPFLRDEAA